MDRRQSQPLSTSIYFGLLGVVHGARGFPRKPLSLGARSVGTVGMGGWSNTLVARQFAMVQNHHKLSIMNRALRPSL